jgi:hypothetical protein
MTSFIRIDNDHSDTLNQTSTDPIQSAVSQPTTTQTYDPRWTSEQSAKWLQAIDTPLKNDGVVDSVTIGDDDDDVEDLELASRESRIADTTQMSAPGACTLV